MITSYTSSATQEDEIFKLDLEELLNLQISVASKFNETVINASSAVTVFSNEEIEKMGAKTLEDLLEHVPSFLVSNLADRKSITVRGSKAYSQVLLLVDGHRINSELFGGFEVTRVDMSLTNVKQVEIIRGPGSALYGANAFLGVIKVTTKEHSSYAGLEVGENNLKNIHGSLYKKIGKTKVTLFSEIYSDQDYKYNSYQDSFLSGDGTVINNRSNPNVKESIEKFDIHLKLKRKKFEAFINHASREYKGSSTADGIAATNHHNISKPSETDFLSKYKFDIATDQWLDFSIGYHESRFNPFGFRGIVNGNEKYTGGVQKENRYDMSINYINILDNIKLASGIEYFNSGIVVDQGLSNFDVNGNHVGEVTDIGEVYTSARINAISTYLNLQYIGLTDFIITSGLRFDKFSNFGSQLSPRLAFVYKIKPTTSFKLMYGKAFRSPNYTETSQDSIIVSPSPELNPENIRTIEAQVLQEFRKSRFGLTLYSTKVSDQIDVVLSGSRFKFINQSTVRREGVELEALFDILDHISIRTNFSQVFNIDETSIVAPDPHVLGAITINWNYKRFNLNLNGTFKKSYKKLDQNDLYVFNSKLEYLFQKDVKFYIRIKNIGNKEYLNTTFVRTNHQTNRGRVISAGFNFKY